MITTTKCFRCKQMAPTDQIVMFGDNAVCGDCKDEYVQYLREGVNPDPDLEQYRKTRRTYLKHEASVRSMGWLYLIGGGFNLLAGVMGLIMFGQTSLQSVPLVAIQLGLGAVAFMTGYWFRKLDAKARIPGTLLSLFGLLGFPIGTIISIYFLYLMHSAKGKMVMSAEYRKIREATPDIKYRTSRIVIVLIILLLILLGVPLLAWIFTSHA